LFQVLRLGSAETLFKEGKKLYRNPIERRIKAVA